MEHVHLRKAAVSLFFQPLICCCRAVLVDPGGDKKNHTGRLEAMFLFDTIMS